MPLTDLKAFMGHQDIQTTMIYVHHMPRHDVADKLSELLNGDKDDPTRRTRRIIRKRLNSETTPQSQKEVPGEGLEPPTRGL